MPLTDDELRAILSRAEAIQASGRVRVTDAEVEAFIQAAEEVGYARPAVELAVREHLGAKVSPPASGELAFARSADGKFYVARVLSSADAGIRVQFLRGGEQTLAPDDVRACSFVPGERIGCSWPAWGPWTCTVVSYNAAGQVVKLSDGWGDARDFPISEVWLNPPKPATTSDPRLRIKIALIGAVAGFGATIGAIITALVLR